MREYEKVIKTYETKGLSKCTCDKCGNDCELIRPETYNSEKVTLLEIRPKYIGDDNNIYLDLWANYFSWGFK